MTVTESAIVYQISPKSLRCGDLTIYKTADVRHLEF